MSDELEQTVRIVDHMAVNLNHYILVFGYRSQKYLYTYNLYTEEWKEHIDRKWRRDPHSCYGNACAAVLGQDVYTFGGTRRYGGVTNALWKLNKTPAGQFFWTKVEYQSKTDVPSPRCYHSGWEYEGNLWTFGGFGPLPNGANGLNNELHYFCPSTKAWTNPKCSGQVSPPMQNQATAIKEHKVWLYGATDDFYELNMQSLTWTTLEPD